MVEIIEDYNKCEGADCAECVEVFPMEILVIKGKKIVEKKQEECKPLRDMYGYLPQPSS